MVMFAKRPSSNDNVKLGEMNRKSRNSRSLSELLSIFIYLKEKSIQKVDIMYKVHAHM